jgi:hypothetical protein
VQHHQRNQHVEKTHHQAADPVGEQVLRRPWPGDHEKGEAETHRIERCQKRQYQHRAPHGRNTTCWLLARLKLPWFALGQLAHDFCCGREELGVWPTGAPTRLKS